LKEEERKKQFLKAVQNISSPSASETDENMSGTESAKAKKL